MSRDALSRTLRLLGLLQTRREWSGTDLAAQLGVTTRTVRRDVERLREEGYPIEGTAGQTGGYRLARGGRLPPLLLDEEETSAIALALTTARMVVDGQGLAVRALAKLAPVLPTRLHEHLTALDAAMSAPTFDSDRLRADPVVLSTLAAACRDNEIIRFSYRSRHGTTSDRRVEPHHLVTAHGRWYLIAYDPDADGWRTFRADRIAQPSPTRHRAPTRELPAPDAATFLDQQLATAPYSYTTQVTVSAPSDVVLTRTGALPGRVKANAADVCTVDVSDDSIDRIIEHLVALQADFTIDNAPPELLHRLREVARRLADAADNRANDHGSPDPDAFPQGASRGPHDAPRADR